MGVTGLDEMVVLREWADRVRGNREQAERLREGGESSDFYAPVAATFKADPRRQGEPELDYLRSLVRPGERWLDIGAGAGRYALPLALQGARVTALDPSPGMLATLREACTEFAVEGIEVVHDRWPSPAVARHDVAIIAHVGYDIEDIGPFLDAMEQHASRLCVAVLLASAPATAAAPAWPLVHGEARTLLPALPDFLAVLLSRGRLPGVWLGERPNQGYATREQALVFLRQQLFIAPGGSKDGRLDAALPDLVRESGGRFVLNVSPVALGVVTWDPSRAV